MVELGLMLVAQMGPSKAVHLVVRWVSMRVELRDLKMVAL
jgi:hypothetical protein